MLKFRPASIMLVILAVAISLLMIAWPPAGWLFIPLLISYTALLAWGAANITSGFYLKSFNRQATTDKILSLTFDDGPDASLTPAVLQILEKYSIPATFFVIGRNAENNRILVKDIHDRGHSLGIHAYHHGFFFDLYGKKKMERDLEMTSQLITEITGQETKLFRPPYGVTNPTVASVARKMGLKVVGWSVRSLDTRIDDPEKLAERVIGRLHPGAVVLMHDNRAVTPKALETIILKAKVMGYRFVRLDEMISEINFTQKAQRKVAKTAKN